MKSDQSLSNRFTVLPTTHSPFILFTSAEKAVNERLARNPEIYLLALAQFATSADTEVVSSPASPNFGTGLEVL